VVEEVGQSTLVLALKIVWMLVSKVWDSYERESLAPSSFLC